MGRAWAIAMVVCVLAGCGAGFPENGACHSDSDCQLCSICGCERAYSHLDTGNASCTEIAGTVACTKGTAADCLSGPLQALCVSGHCTAVARLTP